jgi:prepilin-type N-terminal cleavage/methylation domain-containing protein
MVYHHRFRGEDSPPGFTFLEILIAGTIVAVALLAIYAMIPTAATTINYTGDVARATILAQQRIEELRNLSFATLVGMDTANVPPATPASQSLAITEGNSSFTRLTWVRISGAAPRREAAITLILQWTEPTGAKTLRLDSLIGE